MIPEPLYTSFANVMQVKNFTNDTKKNYNSMLRKFSNEFPHNYKRATTDEIIAYIASLPSRASCAQMYGVLQHFYCSVLKQKRKFGFVPFPKKEQRLPHIPTDLQVKRMIELTENTKHQLILFILYGTGIRLSEIIGIKWSDIKREPSELNPISIHIRGKGNKDRSVGLSKNVYEKLIAYCKKYKLGCETDKHHYILGGEKPYSKKSVGVVVADAGQRIGLKVSPHKIRHAAFTTLRNNGIDLSAIAEIAGHSSLKVTQQYAKLSVSKIEMPV